MNVAGILISSVLAIGPTGTAAPAAERAAQIRCRPAPFYVADRGGERPKLQRAIVTGTRVPIRGGEERRARPCHLMHQPVDIPPSGSGFLRVAY